MEQRPVAVFPRSQRVSLPCRSSSFYLKYVDENVLLGLLGAADVLQDNGVVDALGVWLVQVVRVRLVPLLEGKEDLVLIRAHYLNILQRRREAGFKKENQYLWDEKNGAGMKREDSIYI